MTIESFKGSSFNMVCDGQSLWDNPYDEETGFAWELSETLGCTFSRVWIFGEGWNRLDDNPDIRVYPYCKAAEVNVYMMMGGTTELALGNSGSSIYTRMHDLSDLVRANGPVDYVIGLTVTAAVGIAGAAETQRLDLNSRIIADAGDAFDATVNLCPSAGVNLDDFNSACFSDDTHWSATGQTVAVGLAAPIIAPFMP